MLGESRVGRIVDIVTPDLASDLLLASLCVCVLGRLRLRGVVGMFWFRVAAAVWEEEEC